MLKKFLYSAFALCAVVGAAQAQEVTLKVSHFLPPNSNYQKGVLEPWCGKLLKESEGKLKCQIYPAMQLGGTPPQLVDQRVAGGALQPRAQRQFRAQARQEAHRLEEGVLGDVVGGLHAARQPQHQRVDGGRMQAVDLREGVGVAGTRRAQQRGFITVVGLARLVH